MRVTASQDGPFAGLQREIPITVTDNTSDTGIIVTRNGAAVSSITAGPGTVYASVRLPYQPSSDVTVAVAGADPVSASFAGGSSTATFTSRNWDQSQGLTITVGSGSIDASGVNVGFLPGGGGYTATTIKVFGTAPPTFTISDVGNDLSFKVNFNKAVGVCSTKTATSAAESVCSGTVTAFTNDDVAEDDGLFELTVAKFDPSYDPPRSLVEGAPISYRATISGNVVTIVPNGIAQDGNDITLFKTVHSINVLVKDRYWSVNGGVLGASVLTTLEDPGAGQAKVRLQHYSDPNAFIGIQINSSRAAGVSGNDWTLVPVYTEL